MKFHLYLRRHSYLAALVLSIVQRTLLQGIGWRGHLLTTAVALTGKAVSALVILLLAVSFVRDVTLKPRPHHLLTLLVLGLLSIPAYVTGETMLLFSAALILLGRGIPYRDILTVFYHTAWSSLLALILAHLLGLTDDVPMNFSYAAGHSLGMAHPNNLAAAASVVIFLWAYRQKKQRGAGAILTVLLLACLLYFVTASRTTLIVQITYCLALLLLSLLRRVHAQKLIYGIRFGFVLLMAGSIWMMLHSGQISALGVDDENFLSRFVSAFSLYSQYGVRLFGSYIEFRSLRLALATGLPAVILDPAYLYLLVSQGIVAAVIFFLLFAQAVGCQIRRRQLILLLILGMFMLSGLMERYMLDASMNFVLLSAFAAHDGLPPTASHSSKREYEMQCH